MLPWQLQQRDSFTFLNVRLFIRIGRKGEGDVKSLGQALEQPWDPTLMSEGDPILGADDGPYRDMESWGTIRILAQES